MVSYHPDPPQPLRARLRRALHSYGGKDLNRPIHHERGRYCFKGYALVLLKEHVREPFGLTPDVQREHFAARPSGSRTPKARCAAGPE